MRKKISILRLGSKYTMLIKKKGVFSSSSQRDGRCLNEDHELEI